jgi:hypothetical protein
MFANSFKINLNTIGSASTLTFNIPMSLESQIVDQGELVERVFVDVEMKKAVNPIIDYEKVRLSPIKNDNQINKVVYKLNLFSGMTYGSVGFTDDDIKFKKESFKQTYLELAFYDSDNPMSQNLVSFVTLFSKLKLSDLQATGNIGIPKPANQIDLTFELENELTNPLGITEGYYLYNYKDELLLNVPKYLYMRANFRNAKTGRITNLMVKDTALPIDELVHELYTRYILVRNNNGYYYTIDDSYQWKTTGTPNNVEYTSDLVTITLFEVNAL